MNATLTKGRIPPLSPVIMARMAGVFWLMTILAGTLAMFAGRGGAGSAANLAATAFYMAATLVVYLLLKPVNRNVSFLAAFSSLLGCTIGTLRLLGLGSLPDISFVLFGVHCFLIGCLILRSSFLPRTIGALMLLGGLGWLTLGLSSLLSPPLASSLNPYILVPGIVGEASLTLWLLVAGVDAQRWEEQARAKEQP